MGLLLNHGFKIVSTVSFENENIHECIQIIQIRAMQPQTLVHTSGVMKWLRHEETAAVKI